MSLTGDTVMVILRYTPLPSLTLFKQAWRCYVVYGRSRIVVIFPTVLILASISEIVFDYFFPKPSHPLSSFRGFHHIKSC